MRCGVVTHVDGSGCARWTALSLSGVLSVSRGSGIRRVGKLEIAPRAVPRVGSLGRRSVRKLRGLVRVQVRILPLRPNRNALRIAIAVPVFFKGNLQKG